MKDNRKPHKDLTKSELYKRKSQVCIKCKYSSITSARKQKDPKDMSCVTCDYILIVGHSRGCDPRDCVEKGIFEPKGNFKRRAWVCEK